MKVLNAFSINMLEDSSAIVKIAETDIWSMIDIGYCDMKDVNPPNTLEKNLEFHIGHQQLCDILRTELKKHVKDVPEIKANRDTVTLKEGETALIVQYRGRRLPEGATELPKGAEIKYYYVTVMSKDLDKKYKELKKKFDYLRDMWGSGYLIEEYVDRYLGVKKGEWVE